MFKPRRQVGITFLLLQIKRDVLPAGYFKVGRATVFLNSPKLHSPTREEAEIFFFTTRNCKSIRFAAASVTGSVIRTPTPYPLPPSLILKTIKSTVSDLFLYLFPKPGFAVTHTPAKSSKDSLLLSPLTHPPCQSPHLPSSSSPSLPPPFVINEHGSSKTSI